MKEYFFVLIILLIYLIVSYFMNRYLLKISSTIKFIVIIILYFIGTYYFFSILDKTNYIIKNTKYHLDFGHANTLLVLLLISCFIIGIINVGILIFKRK